MRPIINKCPRHIRGGALLDLPKPEIERLFSFPLAFEEGVFPAYREVKGGFLVPRNFVPYDEAVDHMEDGTAHMCSSAFDYDYDPEQRPFIEQSVELLKQGISHVACARTGFGKTFTGAEVIQKIGRRALIICPKEDLMDQWVVSLKAVMGLSDREIGFWRADQTPQPYHKVVIGLVQSISKGYERYPEELYQGFGLVVVDEVHRIAAEHFSQSMWWLPARLRLGLSATPNRKDGKTILIRGHIGETLVRTDAEEMIPKVLAVRTGWKVPRTMRGGQVIQIPHQAGKTMHLSKLMGRDKRRNSIIVDLVVNAYKKNRHTIVFTDTVEHLVNLKEMLLSVNVPELHIGFYTGLGSGVYSGTKKEQKAQREIAKEKPIILATYQMAREGTNIPILSTCVLGTPKSDIAQSVGRVRRVQEGKPEAVVFDLIDEDSPVFRGYWGARQRWYRRLECPITHIN